jgi:hypothetical protein
MANTISTFTYRNKYMSENLQQVLRRSLVAEKVCAVDRTDLYTIQNPYGSQPTATITGLTGTYAVSDYTTTNDALTVTEQVAYSEHIYRFESTMSNFDLFSNRADELAYAVKAAIDIYVINMLTEAGTGTYTAPTGGFATAANVNTIMANLISKVVGYAESFNGQFLIIEPTDIVGFTLAGATNGFSFADAVLNNGKVTNWMGVDIYVVPASTFTTVSSANTTSGTQTWSNASHRVFGVKGVSTFASPRGVEYNEKDVTGKTGKEISVDCVIGFKLWTQKAGLIVDITLA